MRTATTAVLFLFLAANLFGDEPLSNTASPAEGIGVDTNGVVNESGMEILRDPFWPVGYAPPPPEPEVTEEQAEKIEVAQATQAKIQWPALLLKGITRAGPDRYMAIVEGVGLVETGQTISLHKSDMLYTWKIDEVSARGVRFSRLEARPYQPLTAGVRTQ
ncbi:MAG: hypothetical protein HQ523_03700 [Lentisphaerae bacterium]|nr:hypothetical protein [Lentisphaerota bacterium]